MNAARPADHPELRREATDQVGDFVGDLGVLGRVLVTDQRIDGQIILNQPHVPRPDVFQKLGARVSLLGIVGIVLQFAFHVEEDKTNAGVRQHRIANRNC